MKLLTVMPFASTLGIVCSGEIMRWEIQRIGPVLLLKPATFLFTLVDGTPKLVFGKAGDGYSCLQDGSFFYDGYRSASENGRGIFCFTEDGTALSCKEFYFVRILDGEESDAVVYYNTTGSWEIEDSRKANMTLDEFWAWEPEYMYLSMTPFSAID